MPHIEYLGFVVRQQEKTPENIVAACVAKLEEFGGKKVWKAYPVGSTKFIPMLFVISALIREKLAHLSVPESGIPEDEVLLMKPNPRSDFMLSYLSDVWRKGGRYEKVYEDLRHATRFFFCPHGQKNTLRLIAPQGGMCSTQVFFWTVSDLKRKTLLKDLPKTPTELKNVEDPPQSNQDILPGIHELAENVRRYLAQPESWQDLYRKALMAPEDLPIHQISLYGSRVESKKEEQALLYKEPHLQLSEMLTQHREILLTGPSGSGKTTIQKMLMKDLLGPQPPIHKCIPFFVPLKYIGVKWKSITDSIVDTVTQMILTSPLLKRTIQQQIDLRRALWGDMVHSDSLFASELREFFASNDKKGNSQIVLFLDGYNEIPETEKYAAEQEIQSLAERVDYMVVSTHAYVAPRFPSRFTRFELEELSDEQITLYLDLQLEGKGTQFFEDKITPNGRILSMARVPYYLELIVDYHNTYPDLRLPVCPGPLLKFFVERQYEKKREVKNLRFPDVTQSEIDFFLRKIAYRLIDKGQEEAETVLYYPDDLATIFNSLTVTYSARVTKAAELIGFLDKSGHISEEPGAPGVISFKHDNIRDYYAAQELKNEKVLDKKALLMALLEYTKWDMVFQMYFGLIRNEQQFVNALNTVIGYDPFLATYCLLWSPLSRKNHAQSLLKIFSNERLQTISSNDSYNTLYDVQSALTNILTFYEPDELIALYNKTEDTSVIQKAIPEALIIILGGNALPYFEQITKTSDFSKWIAICQTACNLRTNSTWEFITSKYIELISTGSPFCYMRKFEDLIRSSGLRPPPDLIIKTIKQAKAIISRSGHSKDLSDAICVLGYPIEHLGYKYITDLIKLEKETDEDISRPAFDALCKLHHPKAIRKLRYALSRGHLTSEPLSPSFLYLGRYLVTLIQCELPEIDSKLWELFTSELSKHNSNYRLEIIPRMLAQRTDQCTIAKMMSLVLQANGPLAISSLRAFCSVIPERILPILTSLLPDTQENTISWYKLVVARGLCGDKEVIPHILNLLQNIEHVQCSNIKQSHEFDKVAYHNEFGNAHEFEYSVLHVIDRLKLVEAIPFLKKVFKKTREEAMALYTFLNLLQVKTNEQMREAVSRINKAVIGISFDYWVNILFELLHEWPHELTLYFLKNLRDETEKAIQAHNKKQAEFLYALSAITRSLLRKRCLDIFRGWPIHPSYKL